MVNWSSILFSDVWNDLASNHSHTLLWMTDTKKTVQWNKVQIHLIKISFVLLWSFVFCFDSDNLLTGNIHRVNFALHLFVHTIYHSVYTLCRDWAYLSVILIESFPLLNFVSVLFSPNIFSLFFWSSWSLYDFSVSLTVFYLVVTFSLSNWLHENHFHFNFALPRAFIRKNAHINI